MPPGDATELRPPITDWLLRAIDAAPISPVWVALVFVVAYVALSQIGRVLVGDRFVLELDYLWLDGLNGAIVAYAPTALYYLRRATLNDLRELQPVLGYSHAELERVAADITSVPARRLLPTVAVMVVLFAFMPVYDPSFFADGPKTLGDPALTFFMLRNAITGWVVGVALATEFRATAGYAYLGESGLQIDLLDTRPLTPFTRRGLRSAFTWIAGTASVSLFWLSPGAGITNGPIMITILVMIVWSFFHSIRGVHRSIVAEKRRQLELLRAEIRKHRSELLGHGVATQDGGRLAALIAYHDLVERAREWPFDTPVILRLALFVILGLGSWLGGALVEKLLDAVSFG